MTERRARRDLLRVATAELLRAPGVERRLTETVPAELLGIETRRIVDDAVDVDVVVESTLSGLEVEGTVTMSITDECRRCLRPLVQRVEIDVDELYQEEISEPGAFELSAGYLDLEPVVRDLVLIGLSEPPALCAADCAGICPVCGADRNQDACTCETPRRDDRWAALDQLRPED